jgi:hypothetical protein
VLVIAGGAVVWWYQRDPRQRETHRIQERLSSLAEAISFSPQDATLKRLSYPQTISGFFADPTTLDVAIGDRNIQETLTRAQLEEMAARRLGARGLSIQFLDIAVSLDSAITQATAHLTAKVQFAGDAEYSIQEFRFGLGKTNSNWVVHSVETLRTMEQ